MSLTKALLASGVIAGPIYIAIGVIELLIRPGFDIRYNALSQMALGDLGWIQTASFVISGVLVIACAVGMARALSGRASTWAPRLLGAYGITLLVAAIFTADPGFGFPPGTPAGPPTTMSAHALVHFIAGAVGFFAWIAAAFVFARRFAAIGQRPWAAFSFITGAFFLIAFIGTASGTSPVVFLLGLYVAIVLAWVWLSAVAAELLTEPAAASSA